MDRLSSPAVYRTIRDIQRALPDLEKQGDLSVTLANQIKTFKFELECAAISVSGDYPFLGERTISWINLVERQLLQPIRIGRMPAVLLEETMSGLLQIIDDCPTIDNIYRCLEELENQGDLTMHVESQIQNLKFELRNLRIHLKRIKFSCSSVVHLRSRVKQVEECLLQGTRKGCMNADLLDSTLTSFLRTIMWSKEEFGTDAIYKIHLDYPNALTDDVLEEIDQLQENLNHLIRWNKLSSVVLSKEQIETLEEKLRFLRNFLEIAGMELEEVIKNGTAGDLLTRIYCLIQNAISLSWLSWDKEEHRSMAKFFRFLLADMDRIEPEIRMIYVQLLKASKIENPGTLGIDLPALAAVDSLLDNLQKLLKDQDTGSFIHLDVHQIEILCEELRFLKYFLMDPRAKQHNETEAQSFNSLLILVGAVARELQGSLTPSDCFGRTEDHLLHINLLKIVNLLKIKIRQMYPIIQRQSTSNFPRCPKLGFVNFFIQSLEELLQHKAESIAYVKNEVRTLLSELTLLNSLIRDTNKNLEKNENIASCIVDVSYEAEQVIDLISASHFPKWYCIPWLYDVIEKIKILRNDCSEVHIKMTCETSYVENASSINNPSRAYNLATEEEMVGFRAEAEMIMDQLTRGTEQLDIVSIVGMPGIGKTTLAKKVYEHPSISRYFHVRSWYCISQVCDRQDLLCSILDGLPQRSSKRNDEDMAELLYRSLKGRRYLVVLDDIWSFEPWKDIRDSFPDDCNGSRIMFTSRIREVALQANPRSAPHDLRLLSNEESWELLQQKVFKQRSYPLEIYTIGKKIAENCKGLPLSVVLVAGVLVKLEESVDHWKQVLASLGKQVGDLSKYILELSYKQLPDHLKPCFLYFSAFPEDKAIATWKLIRLWIAEGFILKKTKYESLENVAEGYLMDLIARSLVLISQRKSNGGVKSCHVHDLLHDFSIEKAKDENFLLISKGMPNDRGQYRCCLYVDDTSLCEWIPYDPYVRSVFFYPTIDIYTLHYNSPVALLYNSKLLRVLDLRQTHISNQQFQRLTEVLVHLRYLAIYGGLNHIPSSVANLWRLETFILQGTVGEVKLPEALLEMAYLKHLFVESFVVFELSDHPEKSIKSSSIEKLSKLHLDDCTLDKVLRKLRSVRKLKCMFLRPQCRFPELDLLSELESLSVQCYCSLSKITLFEFCFPSNLKKLTLSGFGLPWSEISKIGRLPQLKVLKLLFYSFRGRRWDVSDEEFCNLKFLKLDDLNIVEWDASPDAFPCLEQLVLKNCERLKEIPSCFGESSSLQMIEVTGCMESVIEPVLKIEKEQQELGATGFKVLIQHNSPPF